MCDTFISVTLHQKTPIFSIIIETSTTEELFKMRKIESQMNRAIRGQRNWTSGNTTVFTTDNGLESTVYLHGNHIATFDHVHQNLYIFDGGWQSNTTKSRLNALIEEFSFKGSNVFQKNFNWYVRAFNTVTPFHDGITIPVV